MQTIRPISALRRRTATVFVRRGAFALAALATIFTLTGVAADPAYERKDGVAKARDAATVVGQAWDARGGAIPEHLLEIADCVAVFPDIAEAAFIPGGTGGTGCVVVRDAHTGQFGPPLFLRIGGGAAGFQLGSAKTSLVLVGVHHDTLSAVNTGEWTLGADTAVAAGPIAGLGADGDDWSADARFLSYTVRKGVLVGVALDGSKISLDAERNRAFYGVDATPERILTGQAKPSIQLRKDLSVLARALERSSTTKQVATP
jgi:lipid-binding SYLF domain-containing protein